ncbi:MAG: hypothetical protein ACR2FY_17485 [Pirellulaceae bacterium]
MKSRRAVFVVLAGLKFAPFVFLLIHQIAIAETDAESLELIAQVYADNREKLQSFTCRFQVTKGIAPSAPAGLAGKFDPASVKAGLWIVDRDNVRYELKCVKGGISRADLIRMGPDKSGFTPVDCLSALELWSAKDRISARVSDVMNVANLHENAGVEFHLTPFSMGAMGPGEAYSPLRYIRDHQAGLRYCKYLGKSRLDDRTVDVIETGLKKVKAGGGTTVWYLDLARGGIPLKSAAFDKDGSLQCETVCTKMRRLDNGAYLSERSVFLAKRRTDGWDASIIELISMDLNVPARELFALELPEKCKVICMKDMRLNVRIDKPEAMHIDDLQEWVKRCEIRGAERISEYEKLGIKQPRKESQGISRWLVIGLSLAAFVVVSVIVRRYLRS